jgi:hypothetical protein
MTDLTDRITALHAAYVRGSGLNLPLTLPRMYAWEVWLTHGWGEAELALVIKRLNFEVRQRMRTETCLRFSRLVEDISGFEEALAMARHHNRMPRTDHGKAQALQSTGRPAPAPAVATQSARQALKSALLSPEWRELKRLGDSL